MKLGTILAIDDTVAGSESIASDPIDASGPIDQLVFLTRITDAWTGGGLSVPTVYADLERSHDGVTWFGTGSKEAVVQTTDFAEGRTYMLAMQKDLIGPAQFLRVVFYNITDSSSVRVRLWLTLRGKPSSHSFPAIGDPSIKGGCSGGCGCGGKCGGGLNAALGNAFGPTEYLKDPCDALASDYACGPQPTGNDPGELCLWQHECAAKAHAGCVAVVSCKGQTPTQNNCPSPMGAQMPCPCPKGMDGWRCDCENKRRAGLAKAMTNEAVIQAEKDYQTCLARENKKQDPDSKSGPGSGQNYGPMSMFK